MWSWYSWTRGGCTLDSLHGVLAGHYAMHPLGPGWALPRPRPWGASGTVCSAGPRAAPGTCPPPPPRAHSALPLPDPHSCLAGLGRGGGFTRHY